MNEYPNSKTNTKQNTLVNLFAIGCILIVCFFGFNLNEQTEGIDQPKEQLQVGTKTGTNQTGNKEIRPERPITKSTSTVKQGTVKNLKKDDSTKQKPLGTNTIKTKVFIKDWKLAYTKLDAVVNNTGITKHILYACINTRNQPHCVNSILGVSKAESSIFRNCYKGSCLGIKPNGSVKTYENVKYGIDDRVSRYNKYRYANDNASEWIEKSNYCNGDCELKGSNWRLSYDSFIGYIK